ncbi:MAG TPA: phosphoribosyltransferase family protein [Rhizomicrobium sp.]
MTEPAKLPVLFSESDIRARVAALADEIVALRDRPNLALPILVGAFVFAADLLRALDERGLPLPVEFLQLRSYGEARVAQDEIRVLLGPGESVRGRHILLIDGVLDGGRTLKTARNLAIAAGARAVTSAVAIDKRRREALLQADFAAFAHVEHFVAGYGMDDAGRLRSLPYIAVMD